MSVTWVQHRREVGAIIQLPEHGDRVLVTAAMRRHKGAYKCLDCRAVEKRRRKLEGK